MNKLGRSKMNVHKPLDLWFRVTQLDDSFGRTHVEIQELDQDTTLSYAIIALEAYKETRYWHGDLAEQFIGVLGEYVVKVVLEKLGIDHKYYERKREHWKGSEEEEKRTADFKIKPNGPLLEICTTPPSGLKNYKCCTVKESKLNFEWDHAIGVKIESIECDAQIPYEKKWEYIHIDGKKYPEDLFEIIKERQVKPFKAPIGKAIIYGYGTRREIESHKNGWERAERRYPCFDYPCIWKPLEKLRPITELWSELKEGR